MNQAQAHIWLAKAVDAFALDYQIKACSPKPGEVWPLEMSEQEWYEQFSVFMETYGGD